MEKKKISECNVVPYFSTLKRMEKYVQQVIDTDWYFIYSVCSKSSREARM